MSWKRTVTREGLWFICAAGGGLLAWSIFDFVSPETQVWSWNDLAYFRSRPYNDPFIAAVVWMGVIYFMRLTAWALKVVRQSRIRNIPGVVKGLN
jgi:hypothetical protein